MISILVGDDLIFSLNNIEKMLNDIGFINVEKVTDAVEVIRQYRLNRPDLVIIDIMGMESFYDEIQKNINTFDAIEIIRQLDNKAKIIVVTSTPKIDIINSAVNVEPDGILIKGFDKEKLKETINKVLPSGK